LKLDLHLWSLRCLRRARTIQPLHLPVIVCVFQRSLLSCQLATLTTLLRRTPRIRSLHARRSHLGSWDTRSALSLTSKRRSHDSRCRLIRASGFWRLRCCSIAGLCLSLIRRWLRLPVSLRSCSGRGIGRSDLESGYFLEHATQCVHDTFFESVARDGALMRVTEDLVHCRV
jgi:hypothetical protein